MALSLVLASSCSCPHCTRAVKHSQPSSNLWASPRIDGQLGRVETFKGKATQKLPEFEAEGRPKFADTPKFRIIRLGNREDFESIFTLLARSKSPLSPQDQEDVKWFIAQHRDGISRLLPEQIPCKENLGFLSAELIRNTSDADAVLGGHVKTATDVLRIPVAMSGGDVSLATACKFGKFRRCERALLLCWIDRAGSRTEDMLR